MPEPNKQTLIDKVDELLNKRSEIVPPINSLPPAEEIQINVEAEAKAEIENDQTM
jgi:hypothetical protein